MKKIVVLDYGLGNVRSVRNALHAIGAQADITRDKTVIDQSDGMIVPGVGAFPHGMECLEKFGLVQQIKAYIESGRQVLGICLGMQLLFQKSTEFKLTEGLGLISGSVERIPVLPNEGRLPHIAWSTICPTNIGSETLFYGLPESELRFYFVHSFAAYQVPKENVSATVKYLGHDIVAAAQHGNVWGTQFHPEKSGSNGLQVLKNFVNRCNLLE